MDKNKRFVIAGTGSRADMYLRYLLGDGARYGHKLVGFCDLNPGRMAFANRQIQEKGGEPVATAEPDAFEALLKEQRADGVIVTTIDRTHDAYICRAMEAGCDVVTEKPMTTTSEKCKRILETQSRTGRELRVTFNYRYAPRNSKVKELLQSGCIGNVHSIHFEWLLNTKHGADYFRRWHRDKRNSGGLMVHKSTHHFDLVNWWLDTSPETVMAMGDLKFYGRENAEKRGVRRFYDRGTGNPLAADDPFALKLDDSENLKAMYLDNEHYDGYRRDESVFSHGISIEDDVGVLVRYRNKAVMSYHLTAYSPWEGYRVMFNGDKGRLEYEVVETAYVSGKEGDHNLLNNVSGAAPYEITEPSTILLRPHWQPVQKIELASTNEGGHGGGDIRMLEDIFGPGTPDPLHRAAGQQAGADSILTGIAANQSLATGLPVAVDAL